MNPFFVKIFVNRFNVFRLARDTYVFTQFQLKHSFMLKFYVKVSKRATIQLVYSQKSIKQISLEILKRKISFQFISI